MQHEPELEGLVQRMLDAQAPEETIKEVVRLYRERRNAPLSEKEQAAAMWAGTKEGIGQTWPVTAGIVGAAALPIGAAAGVVRTLTRPGVAGTVGAIGGGIQGYKRGGVFGGLEGAVRGGFEGAVGGRAVHGLGGLLRTAGLATAPEAVASVPQMVQIAGQRVPVASLGPAARRLILNPADAAAEARLEQLASGAGTLTGSAGAKARAAREMLTTLMERGE